MKHNPHYFPAFDGIRAVAMLAVFVSHYPLTAYNSVLTFGRLGVSIFFVLSGLLITGALLRSRGELGNLKTFYMRRVLRIFPLYWGFWIVVVCLTGVLHVMWNRGNWLYVVYAGNYIWSIFGDRFGAPAALVHLGIWPNAAGIPHQYIYVGHFWTLTVEEQFYLFWPLLILRPKRIESVLRICVAIIVAVIVAKVAVSFWAAGFPGQWIRVMPLRCDEFAFGGALATLLFVGRGTALIRKANWIFYGGTAALVLSCLVNLHLTSELGAARWDFLANTLAADVFTVGLILVGMDARRGVTKALSWKPMVMLGQISYGFYLFHDLGHVAIRNFADAVLAGHSEALRDACAAGLAFLIALVFAALSFLYLETPFLKLKDKWKSAVSRA